MPAHAMHFKNPRRSQRLVLPPLRHVIEHHGREKQCNGEVNQHYMLRVLGQENRLEIERIYHRHYSFKE